MTGLTHPPFPVQNLRKVSASRLRTPYETAPHGRKTILTHEQANSSSLRWGADQSHAKEEDNNAHTRHYSVWKTFAF